MLKNNGISVGLKKDYEKYGISNIKKFIPTPFECVLIGFAVAAIYKLTRLLKLYAFLVILAPKLYYENKVMLELERSTSLLRKSRKIR